MKEKKGDIIAAAYVYWSRETIPFLHILEDEIPLQEERTPETILMEKDFQKCLSKECLLMAKTIMNLPEEMFLINGKLKKMELRKLIKEQTGWSVAKIDKVKENLAQQLIDLHNGEVLISFNC